MSKENDHLIAKIKVAGNTLKERREEMGLLRTDLSRKTKISVTVIEAIEKGWRNQLPERAYLMKMLVILENELNLDPNTLKDYLIEKESDSKKYMLSSPISIELFSSWIGSGIYIVLMLTSICLINQYQSHLSNSDNGNIEYIIVK